MVKRSGDIGGRESWDAECYKNAICTYMYIYTLVIKVPWTLASDAYYESDVSGLRDRCSVFLVFFR